MGSDFQRTLMWVILVASCFMLWDNWNVYNGKPSFSENLQPRRPSRRLMRLRAMTEPTVCLRPSAAVPKRLLRA